MCSVTVVMMWSVGFSKPFRTRFSDAVAFAVKATFAASGTPNRAAVFWRSLSVNRKALREAVWLPRAGLPR